MERSTPAKIARSERIKHSPYARPGEPTSRRTPSAAPLYGFRSLVSYVTSSFSRASAILPTTTHDLITNGKADVDAKSEDGSEDEWNGEPPAGMGGRDVYDLAAAGGREGEAFEHRADEWRQRGEVTGGRRDLARRELIGTSTATPEPPTPTMPGHLRGLKATPSMPTISSTSATGTSISLKRVRSPPMINGLPSRSPLPSFVPPQDSSSALPDVGASASWAALEAFIKAKNGQQMDAADWDIVHHLTDMAETETSVAGSPPKQQLSLGGWSAGTFASPSRVIRPLARANGLTPLRQAESAPAIRQSTFSSGMGGPLSPARRRQEYYGPGISPRRVPGRPRTPAQPLSDDVIESPAKKRRTEGNTLEAGASGTLAEEQDQHPITQARYPVKLASKQSPASFPVRPSPLSQTIVPPSTPESIVTGKKNAASIMREFLMDELEDSLEKPTEVIINHYDTIERRKANAEIASSTPNRSASKQSGANRKMLRSALKASGSTPERGAAARIAQYQSTRKLTARERLDGKEIVGQPACYRADRQWGDTPTASKGRKLREDTPTAQGERLEEDSAEIDSFLLATPRLSAAPSRSPEVEVDDAQTSDRMAAPSRTIPELLPIKPLDLPTLNSSSLPISTYKSSPLVSTFDSPLQQIATASATAKPKVPLFTSPALPKPLPANYEDEESPYYSKAATAPSKAVNFSAVFLSAKDSALKVAAAGLPFFTFTIPSPAKDDDRTRAAKAGALSRQPPSFTFTMPQVSLRAHVAAKLTQPADDWTCGLCSLKNPASQTEKCSICDAPRA